MIPFEKVDIGILTVISPELSAVRTALGLRNLTRQKELNGTIYWHGSIYSKLSKQNLSFCIAAIGHGGNYDSATSTMDLIKTFSPRMMFLVGIAAGIRGKTKIGQVVLPDRVVAYEMGALVDDGEGSKFKGNPDIFAPTYTLEQDLTAYMADLLDSDHSNLEQLFNELNGQYPKAPVGKEKEYEDNVATKIIVGRSAIASGEKLLRNPAKLQTLMDGVHRKIEIGEMEATGFVKACERERIDWMVIRGVSDFGDKFKSDDFHVFASKAASVVLRDFIINGLELSDQKKKQIRG